MAKIKEVVYNGKNAKVLEQNSTHILIQFESGIKIATPIAKFHNHELIY